MIKTLFLLINFIIFSITFNTALAAPKPAFSIENLAKEITLTTYDYILNSAFYDANKAYWQTDYKTPVDQSSVSFYDARQTLLPLHTYALVDDIATYQKAHDVFRYRMNYYKKKKAARILTSKEISIFLNTLEESFLALGSSPEFLAVIKHLKSNAKLDVFTLIDQLVSEIESLGHKIFIANQKELAQFKLKNLADEYTENAHWLGQKNWPFKNARQDLVAVWNNPMLKAKVSHHPRRTLEYFNTIGCENRLRTNE